MNVLIIANKATYPPDGGVLAILSLAKGYIKNGHQVYLLNMVTHKHYNKSDMIEPEYQNKITIQGIQINTRISVFALFLNYFFSKKPYISKRFVNKIFQKRTIELVQSKSFDIIQLESLFMLQYIPFIRKYFKGQIIYRPHNLEHEIWERNAKETKSIFKKIYYHSLANRLKKLEKSLLNSYDFILPISIPDAKKYTSLGNYKPLIITPFGIDFEKIPKNGQTNQHQNIIFIGALDWIPNQNALKWFINNCWQKIIKNGLDIKLLVAGRNAPNWLIKFLEKQNGVKFLGEIKSSTDFIQNNGPLIVPLFSGSGLRIKIIEAMALKKAIISTTTGAEGIPYTNEKDILIANTSNEFIDAVTKLVQNKNYQDEIGKNAYRLTTENFDLKKIAKNVLDFIK